MTTATIDGVKFVVKLQRRLAALGDGGDARSDHERAAYRRDYDTIQGVISGLMNAPDDLARVEMRLADLEARRAAWLAKESELEQAITETPDWRTGASGTERDRLYDRRESLKRQLQMLRDGTLLAAPGVTFERLGDLDARIAELTDRRDRARLALDGHLAAAGALLGEGSI